MKQATPHRSNCREAHHSSLLRRTTSSPEVNGSSRSSSRSSIVSSQTPPAAYNQLPTTNHPVLSSLLYRHWMMQLATHQLIGQDAFYLKDLTKAVLLLHDPDIGDAAGDVLQSMFSYDEEVMSLENDMLPEPS